MNDQATKDFDTAIGDAMKLKENVAYKKPVSLTRDNYTAPGKTNIVADVTNKDVDRSTRSMSEQMYKIIAGLEDDISDAIEIRDIVNKRISDLSKALNAARASLDVLKF
jgi:hypothetical protein